MLDRSGERPTQKLAGRLAKYWRKRREGSLEDWGEQVDSYPKGVRKKEGKEDARRSMPVDATIRLGNSKKSENIKSNSSGGRVPDIVRT